MPAHIVFPQVDSEPAGYSAIWIKKILREELGFQGIVFSDDLSMSGAANAGGVTERAACAIAAGCDIVLLCNDRPGTEQLLATSKSKIEPLTQVRFMRMHGKHESVQFTELADDPRWLAANESIARAGHSRALDLGDDMLS
jgi:beta-N-acetylhexosaminidase